MTEEEFYKDDPPTAAELAVQNCRRNRLGGHRISYIRKNNPDLFWEIVDEYYDLMAIWDAEIEEKRLNYYGFASENQMRRARELGNLMIEAIRKIL